MKDTIPASMRISGAIAAITATLALIVAVGTLLHAPLLTIQILVIFHVSALVSFFAFLICAVIEALRL